MNQNLRAAELQSATERAVSQTRARAFQSAEIARGRILDLNRRIHTSLLALRLGDAVYNEIGVSTTEF